MDVQTEFMQGLTTLLNKVTLLEQDEMKAHLKGFKAAEVHTIEYIGDHAGENLTTIAAALYVTRGAVSKMTKRLLARDLITGYHRPGNQKEVYFRLTPAGQAVYDTHARLNRQFAQRDQPVFAALTAEQAATLVQFMDQYNQHLDHLIDAKLNK